MTFDEYKGEIERIIRVFGNLNYPDERIMEIWSRLKNTSINSFKCAVSDIILNTRRSSPPMLQDFYDALRPYKPKDYAVKKEQESTEPLYYHCDYVFPRGQKCLHAGVFQVEIEGGGKMNICRAHKKHMNTDKMFDEAFIFQENSKMLGGLK